MIDRRDFVRSTAVTMASGGLLALDLTAASPATWPRRMRVTFRWGGGGLMAVPNWNEHIGDYVVFLGLDRGRATGPFDVFHCDDPPPGVLSESILSPLGRNEKLKGARVLIETHLSETWNAWLSGDGPRSPALRPG